MEKPASKNSAPRSASGIDMKAIDKMLANIQKIAAGDRTAVEKTLKKYKFGSAA